MRFAYRAELWKYRDTGALTARELRSPQQTTPGEGTDTVIFPLAASCFTICSRLRGTGGYRPVLFEFAELSAPMLHGSTTLVPPTDHAGCRAPETPPHPILLAAGATPFSKC